MTLLNVSDGHVPEYRCSTIVEMLGFGPLSNKIEKYWTKMKQNNAPELSSLFFHKSTIEITQKMKKNAHFFCFSENENDGPRRGWRKGLQMWPASVRLPTGYD